MKDTIGVLFATSKRITRALEIFSFFAAFIAADSVLAQVWSETTAPNKSWYAVATSSDGSRLAAAFYNGGIYTSSNSGVIWNLTSAPAKSWSALASSASGNVLLAAATSGGVYTSTNFGSTWQSNGVPGNYNWDAAASSADGNTLIVGGNIWGPVYYSTNGGASWRSNGIPTGYWTAVVCTADGTKLAVEWSGVVYCSTNSGATWTNYNTSYGTQLACSADGSKLLLASSSLNISTNWGMTWVQATIPSSTLPFAASADAGRLVQLGYGVTYLSTNLGANWTTSYAPSKTWRAITLTADGAKLLAVVNSSLQGYSDGIYLWSPPLLGHANVSGNLVLSWPTNGTVFNLQVSSDLTTWLAATNVSVVTNAQNQVIVSPGDSNGFFRIVSQ